VYTAYDAIEYLLSSTGGGAQDQEHRVLRQALFHAYRDLVSARDWKWYHTAELLPIFSGDLIVTHRLPWGVSSVDSVYLPQLRIAAEYVSQTEWRRIENSPFQQLVRLVWTVLPSAEKEGYFDLKIYNGYRYSETLTLTYRRRPRDLRLTGWEPSSRAGTVTTTIIPVPASQATATANLSGGEVASVTVTAEGRGYSLNPKVTINGGGGTGATATSTISNGSLTGITVTSGGTGYTGSPPATVTIDPPPSAPPGTYFSVSGAGTSFSASMAGAILRVSGDAAWHPEGLAGMRPYVMEAYITNVGGTVTLTVHSPEVAPAHAGSKYIVTDLLDISPTMYTALLSGAEVWAARLLGKGIEGPASLYSRDLRMAFEQDTLAPASGRRWGTGGYFSFWYLRPGVDQGVSP
jgi:hypothetical protein